jgi:transcriptional regulator with XRE-family HTH domain
VHILPLLSENYYVTKFTMPMHTDQFKAWRKLLKLTQAEAATKLGISRRSVELYESGTRGDSARKVAIPRAIELACAAIAAGIESYAGPERHPIKWRVDVTGLLTNGVLPEAVVEWWRDNLRSPIIVQNGFAAFDTDSEATKFKTFWIG